MRSTAGVQGDDRRIVRRRVGDLSDPAVAALPARVGVDAVGEPEQLPGVQQQLLGRDARAGRDVAGGAVTSVIAFEKTAGSTVGDAYGAVADALAALDDEILDRLSANAQLPNAP